MKYSTTLLFVACLFAASLAQTTKYPMIIYSREAFSKTEESSGAMHTHDVMDKLQEAMTAAKAGNLLLIVKDGFSSKELVMNAKKFENLKQMIQFHSSIYTNLRQPFDFEAVKSTFPETRHYRVGTLNEAIVLTKKVFDDLEAAGKEQNVIIVEVKEIVSMEDFDHVIMTLQEGVISHNHETVIVVSGREGVASNERMMNLQQGESTQ